MPHPAPQIFGAHALPPFREKLRRLSSALPGNKFGKWGVSVLRKLAVGGCPNGARGPIDVEVAPGVKARLFPATNLCEKRAFCGVQNWDPAERAALAGALRASEAEPFIFLDVGANVGLYSLFLAAEARRLGKAVRIIAVEPDPLNRSRLEFNIAASGAEVGIEPVAIGAEPGEGRMGGGQKNRGEVHLEAGAGEDGALVRIETLAGLIARHGLNRVDAMKVDIEGYDLVALRALFAQAPPALWPKLLVVEKNESIESQLVAMILEQGYDLAASTGMNAILRRPAG